MIDTLPRIRTAQQRWLDTVDAHAGNGRGRAGQGYEELIPAGARLFTPDLTEHSWADARLAFLDPERVARRVIALDLGYPWPRAAAAVRALLDAGGRRDVSAVIWLTHGHDGPRYLVLLDVLRRRFW
ncbi:hypothetical protein [Kineococcus terrestris]|uniref:hypothetical protein n=1 Tax=Kineococcus terrestris TaxID=2044856 RepID=UPI0034DB5A5D